MKIRAAITKEKEAPFEFTEIELAEPKADEILVRIQAAGVCHTDEAGRSGVLPFSFPAVLGHEGAGIVEKVGEGVTGFQKGDPVCLTYASCGTCKACIAGRPYACERMNEINFFGVYPDGANRIMWQGEKVSSFFSQSSFAGYALVSQRSAVHIPEDIDFAVAAPFGCGVQTGAGIVLNSLKPEFGSSLVVGGCGTVGMCAIMAGKLCGCAKIIAVGGNPASLELAKELGATHTINRKEVDDLSGAIMQTAGGGVDYAVDTSGNGRMISSLLNSLTFTGSIAIAGGGFQLMLGSFDLCARTIKGVSEGDSNPQQFIPQLMEAYRQGRFPVDRLIRTYPFESINEAFADSGSGKCIKAVLQLCEE
ncbi:MAG: NAD(P)-dependent alcohol dehydrogenase [Eubacterium sp.]|nr:NAD(P)-dependent alcohol dehydrogenase [Eubacterium sp.]